MSSVPIPRTYSLTALVGRRANEGRTATIATVEFQRRHGAIVGIAAGPAILVGLVAGTVIGVYGILLSLAVEAVAFFLFERRTRDGLRLRTWEALNDRRVADTGRMFICGVEVDPGRIDAIQVSAGSVPLRTANDPAPPAVATTPVAAPKARRNRGEPQEQSLGQAEALAAALAGRAQAPAFDDPSDDQEDAWSIPGPTSPATSKEFAW